METNATQVAVRQPPPYVSYATFSNALTSVVEHGAPSQIDRSILKQFSGFNQNLIFQAFRFMGFTNEKDETTESLHAYEKATPEARKDILAQVLKSRYPDQVKVLENGTPQRLNDSFRDLTVEPSVKKKCVSFFLQMAKAADLPISVHILRSSRAQGSRSETARKRVSIQRKGNGPPKSPAPQNEIMPAPQGMVQVPIAVGIGVGKTWHIMMDKNASVEEKSRFIQMAGIALGINSKY